MNDGFLILSGIIKERLEDVVAVYNRLGITLFKTYTKDEWVCLIFHNKDTK